LTIVFAALSLRYAAIFKDEPAFVLAMEKAEPTSPLVFTRKAELLRREGRAAAAEEAYSRAVELDPRDADALRELGTLEMERGDLAAAEAHFRRAIAEEPYASRPFKLLVIALARAGQTQHAFALMEESAKLWPSDFQVQLMDAAFLATRGERAAAEKAFERAQRLRPGDPALAGGFDSAVARLAPMLGAPGVPPG
jgi:Tfp pilus assembly protein PilF